MGFHDANGIYRLTEIGAIRANLASLYLAAGTPLAAFANATSPTPGLAFDNSKAAGIRWNNDPSPVKVLGTIALPSDRKPGTDITMVIEASKSGATLADAVTFTVEAFNQVLAALQDADTDFGGVSGAMQGDAVAKTVQRVTRTLASVDLADAPSVMTFSLKPTAGLLGTDDVTVHGVWFEYTKVVKPA